MSLPVFESSSLDPRTGCDPVDRVELSIVTTAYNERGNVQQFLQEALNALNTLGVRGEIVYIDDGSTDGTGEAVRQFCAAQTAAPIVLVKHERRLGITAGINESVAKSRGDLICYLPADLESRPEEDVPKLFDALNDDVDVVVGWRDGRSDGKLFASRVYNRLNSLFFGINLHDANWIKLIRREMMLGIRLRSDWHRFLIPVLVHRGCRVREVKTKWHQRKYGRSNFGRGRILVSIADIIAVKLVLSFGHRPFYFYMLLSMLSIGLSLVSLLFVIFSVEPASLFWMLGWTLFGIFGATSLVCLTLGAAIEIQRPLIESGER